MEHLSLEIFDLTGSGSKYAMLPEDTSITITETSEIFASGDVWSHSFTLNVFANAHIFGTAGDIHGSRLHDQLHHRRARLWVEGIPIYTGYLKLDDEADVDEEGDVDVTFESGQKTFNDLIEGAKANQVPLMTDVRFGVALWRKRKPHYKFNIRVRSYDINGKISEWKDGWVGDEPGVRADPYVYVFGSSERGVNQTFDGNTNPMQEFPRMVFPKGTFSRNGQNVEIDCLNTDYPYTEDGNGTPTHPYCNVAFCYQKQGYTRKLADGSTYEDYSTEPEAQREYEEMPANRVNSAPNFYVIYWLRCLMKYLGILVEENQMLDVEDLRRLFFVNSACEYNKKDWNYSRVQSEGYTNPSSAFVPEESVIFQPGEAGLAVEQDSVVVGEPYIESWEEYYRRENYPFERFEVVVLGAEQTSETEYLFHDAYATSKCFPDADISETINALQNGFGVRLLFDKDYKRVRIVLLREILRSQEIQDINAEVIEDVKSENNIRGFRLTYGNTEDTHFYYKGFADLLPHKKVLWPDDSDTHDYSKWSLNEQYHNLLDKVAAFNKTCYVTPNTGNAYGVKIDKDAKRYDDLHPSLFEFAAFMDAEDGDCTGEEETIETIQMGFSPIIMNDLNYKAEKDKDTTEQRFAIFVDEKMRPRRPDLEDGVDYNKSEVTYYTKAGTAPSGRKALYDADSPAVNMKKDGYVKPGEFAICSDSELLLLNCHTRVTFFGTALYTSDPRPFIVSFPVWFNLKGHINEGYRLYLQDNYEPNDDGVSPIETHEWGLTLGIMRGSGSDAYVEYKGDPDDEEGNDTWELRAGSSATCHPDTCDSYGNQWDYNGTLLPTRTPEEAASAIRTLYPSTANSLLCSRYTVKASLLTAKGYNTHGADPNLNTNYFYVLYPIFDKKLNRNVNVYFTPILWSEIEATENNRVMSVEEAKAYILNLYQTYRLNLTEHDTRRVILAVDCHSWGTLAELRSYYFGYTPSFYFDNGLGVTAGRLSLKLRTEKPNPYFDPTQPESESNRRYLETTDTELQGRGIADQLYKEYSYWVRNARIIKRTMKMDLATLQSIDKTKKVRIGDIIGFVRKMQYSVSIKTGLGAITMEIMYI